MKGNPTITNLKEFVDFYSAFKSDLELANLLDISIDDIENAKNIDGFSQVKNHLTLV